MTTTIRSVLTISMMLGTALVSAQQFAPSFSFQQAQRGEVAYRQHCSACHGQNLSDALFAPPLKGRTFIQRWGGRPLDELFIKIVTTMPTSAPRSLGNETYTDVLAYLLGQNGVKASTGSLPDVPAQLAQLVLPTSGDSPTGGVVGSLELPPPPRARTNPLDDISSVTEMMLSTPPSGDWLTWRRDNGGSGFSPLKQINTANVEKLRVAWSWALPSGPSQVTPLVHDGVMFVHGFNDEVQALDARDGTLLWSYLRWIPGDTGIFYPGKRSMAIVGDRLYVPTTDAFIVALDIKTGKVAWEQEVANVADGFRISGGPLIAKGKVMVGTAGRTMGGNFIVGLDAKTGKEAWRVNTIEGPDDPEGGSWAGVPYERRHGASVWVPGNYDPISELAFFGTGQTYDTGPLLDAIGEDNSSNAALYTDSTVAIDPDTGHVEWFFQHFPNDQWDLDWAFERHIVKLDKNNQQHTTVATAGKIGIFDLLDAATGRYAYSIDLGLQNIVTAIDPDTGLKHIDPDKYPNRTEARHIVCPHADGAKNWIPSAYNAESSTLFVPLMEICMDMIPVPDGEKGGFSSGVQWVGRPVPNSDGKYGRIQAIDLKTGKTKWTHRQRAPRTSGLLATEGGLLFGGDLDRYFSAYDQRTGLLLWQIRLNDVSNSGPISYLADGKQYIAVTVGHGRLAVARSALTPEIRLPTEPSATLWVFEVADD